MKNHTLIISSLIFLCSSLFSQDLKQMFVHHKGEITSFVLSEVDSITFSKPKNQHEEQPMPERLVGGDISMLPQYEANGNIYYDDKGQPINNLIRYFKNIGLNTMRVRLFVDPSKASADAKGEGVVQDLNYVMKLGRRIKEEGLRFLLDFHYSDTWADPAQQEIPHAWQSTPAYALNDTLYNYTKRCLALLKQNNATPDFIQIGNEISYGMLWPTGKAYATDDNNWTVFSNFLKSCSKACREVCPNAQIIVHIERSGNASYSKLFYQKMADYQVDYDIIGLSYYPFWHNDIATLSNTLNTLETNFPNKKIQIVETAYYYQWQPEVEHDFKEKWNISQDGQKNYLMDLINELKKHQNVNALYWWFPEENGNGVIDNWVNRGLFDDNTGKALPALYELGKFADSPSNH